MRHGNTFTDEEVECMNQLVRKLLAGEDLKVLARQPAFASVARKFQNMRNPVVHRVYARRSPTSS